MCGGKMKRTPGSNHWHNVGHRIRRFIQSNQASWHEKRNIPYTPNFSSVKKNNSKALASSFYHFCLLFKQSLGLRAPLKKLSQTIHLKKVFALGEHILCRMLSSQIIAELWFKKKKLSKNASGPQVPPQQLLSRNICLSCQLYKKCPLIQLTIWLIWRVKIETRVIFSQIFGGRMPMTKKMYYTTKPWY